MGLPSVSMVTARAPQAPPNGSRPAASILATAALSIAAGSAARRPRIRNAIARAWGRARRYVGTGTALSLFSAAAWTALPAWASLVVTGVCVLCLELHVHAANSTGA